MLSIVGTPIGNLSDLSLRQAQTIAGADVILCEDTRTTGILLQKITSLFGFPRNPNQRLISYYMEKEMEKLPEIIPLLGNHGVVLISQSGLPLISDPGSLLVRQCTRQKIAFTVVPGPTAFTTALLHSGFNLKQFMFCGFVPKKSAQFKNLITKLAKIGLDFPDITFGFYESPLRIKKALEMLADIVPDSNVIVCRELTKKFEEVKRGKPSELLKYEYKGEITLLFQLD